MHRIAVTGFDADAMAVKAQQQAAFTRRHFVVVMLDYLQSTIQSELHNNNNNNNRSKLRLFLVWLLLRILDQLLVVLLPMQFLQILLQLRKMC